MIRIVSLALFSLMLVAGSASAACTWVLWPKRLGGDFVQSLLVYDTRQECERSPKDFIKNWDSKEEEEKWGKLGVQRAHPGHWTCLPDTIDPRGPRPLKSN